MNIPEDLEWLIGEIAQRYHCGKSSVQIWGRKNPQISYEGMLTMFELLGLIRNSYIESGIKRFDIDESAVEALQKCVLLKDNSNFLNFIKSVIS
jgi:hypothetical protein